MQKRKREFFLKIYNETYEELLQYVKKIYRYDPMMAEDVLQETYLTLLNKLDVVMKHENIMGWMKNTAKFKTFQVLDKYHKTEEVLGEFEWETYDNVDALFQDFSELKQFITEDELILLRKYYDEGYSLDEMAEKYHISKGAVKMRIQRVVKKLKQGMTVCLLFL